MKNIQRILESRPALKRMLLLVGTLILILLCSFTLSTLATARHAQAAQRGAQTTYESVRISGGDSLWSIARKYRGTKDTAAFVAELKTVNDLSSDRIQAGSYILVPVTSVL